MGRSEAACRQLAVRARRHMAEGRPRFEPDRQERDELAARFFDALHEGDLAGLQKLLAVDVSLVGDAGGKAPQLARAVLGAQNVARLLAAVFPLLTRIDVTCTPHEVNGQPGAIFRDRDGRVLQTFSSTSSTAGSRRSASSSTPTNSATWARWRTPGPSPRKPNRPAEA